MAKGEPLQRQIYFQNARFLNTGFARNHPPEQLFDICKLQYLLSATPFSHK